MVAVRDLEMKGEEDLKGKFVPVLQAHLFHKFIRG